MDKLTIRRVSSDYIGATDLEKHADIEIKSTSSGLVNSIVDTDVNLNILFMEEREKCRRYRLVLTINPYCTNALFNPCTEITYLDNGELKSVTYDNKAECDNAIGKKRSLEPIDMIRNTEYSSEKHGFDYKPGLDIFNNHIFRNKSYRIVNRLKTNDNNDRFNTLSDDLRLQDGSVLKKCCRLDINDTSFKPKHLYDYDDILSFENGEAVAENLKEQDGWFGFYNTSTIDSKDSKGNSLDLNRVMNNKGNCQFVDMYPGRELFSFAPQYNSLRNRVEYNWDIVLTYPYDTTVCDESGNDFHVIQSNGCNGLFICEAVSRYVPSGKISVTFRTMTKHNLKTGDIVHLYYNENDGTGNSEGVWYPVSGEYTVSGTGDAYGKYDDWYFSIENTDLIENVLCMPKENETVRTSWDYIRDIFYIEIDNLYERKIPQYSQGSIYSIYSLVYSNNEIYVCVRQLGNSFDECFVKLSDYCRKYASEGLTSMPTVNDVYIKVGSSYYAFHNHDNDIDFSDVCDVVAPENFIENIINNAFRTESYNSGENQNAVNTYISFRVKKTSVNGNDCEYYVRKFRRLPVDMNSEQYGLGFATTVYGDAIGQITYTDTLSTDGIKGINGRELTDIYATVIKTNRGYKEWYVDKDYDNDSIEVSRCFGPVTCGFEYFIRYDDTKAIRELIKNDFDVRYFQNNINSGIYSNINDSFITSADDFYYGDIVEYNPEYDNETVLCDVAYRFNTAQRELCETEASNNTYRFIYDEIVSDDYDGEFSTKSVGVNGEISIDCHEGYYYNPHHRIRLRGLGELIQDSNVTLFPKSAKTESDGNVTVVTSVTHKLETGDEVIFRYDGMKEVKRVVKSVIGSYMFKVDGSKAYDDPVDYDVHNLCQLINSKKCSLSKINAGIPEYASKIGAGTFLWRNTVGLWDDYNESKELVFANGSLYIDEIFNMYLKRQNADNTIDGIKPNSVVGYPEGLKSVDEHTYDYINEEEYKC